MLTWVCNTYVRRWVLSYITYCMFLVEVGHTVSVSVWVLSSSGVGQQTLWRTVLLWCLGPLQVMSEKEELNKEEERQCRNREVVVNRDTDRKQHIRIQGWFQLTHPSPPRSLNITFALQHSNCLTHSWWKLHVCSQGCRAVNRMHTPTVWRRVCVCARSHAIPSSWSINKLFNCYMGESDVSLSLHHINLCASL